jgi:hypothetical protein
LNKSPFESARSISDTLRVIHSTVLLHLHDCIGFRLFHLHWVPLLLTQDLRGKRKEYAKAMLSFLYAAERDNWHHLVIDEKSWFFWIYHDVTCGLCREMMWSQNRDLKFRAKHSCLWSCGIWAASILSTDYKIIPKWTATIL